MSIALDRSGTCLCLLFEMNVSTDHRETRDMTAATKDAAEKYRAMSLVLVLGEQLLLSARSSSSCLDL